MKNILVTLLTLFVGTVMAQDVLITSDGDPIKAWGVEVSDNAVFYRESEDEDAPIKRIKKESLLMIKYQNGEKVLMNEPPKVESSQTPSLEAHSTASVEDKEANEEAIQRFNNLNDVSYGGKASKNIADMLFCILKATSSSTILDQNVMISVTPSRFCKSKSEVMDTRNNYPQGCAFVAQLKNRSNRTVFVDLGTSFFIRGSEAVPYYIPQAVASSSSQTTGVGVNMGSVARAAGVGGSLGTLANGVTVGGGTTNETSTITYSQRIIAIPPFSSITLEEQYLFPDNTNQVFGPAFSAGPGSGMVITNKIGNTMEWAMPENEKLKIGEERELPEENNPLCFAFHFTYSFSEDISDPHLITLQLYTGKVIGVRRRSALASNYKEMEHGIFPEKFRDIVAYMCGQ